MERCRKRCAARKDKSLAESECKMFSKLWSQIESKFINIRLKNSTESIRTIAVNSKSERTPLVLVHGMGGAVGFWTKNLQSLASKRPVYAFDLLGFGRSSHPKFSSDASEAESQFVESIEQWRKEMGLEKFVLLGHSLGGYLSTAYTIKYPERVRHLVLADPWGFQDMETSEPREYPTWVKIVAKAAGSMNPFAVLRAAGPFGLRAVKRFRSDLLSKFSSVANEEDVAAYIFHCNSQTPSGEAGFKALNLNLGWAKNPMIRRVPEIPDDLGISMLFGSDSWLDSAVGDDVRRLHHNSHFQVLPQAGHHLYADRAALFNDSVNRICDMVEVGKKPTAASSRENDVDYAQDVVSDVSNRNHFTTSPSMPNFTRNLSKSEESLSQI